MWNIIAELLFCKFLSVVNLQLLKISMKCVFRCDFQDTSPDWTDFIIDLFENSTINSFPEYLVFCPQ